MNSNWFKVAMRAMGITYGKGVLLEGAPVIFNKKGAEMSIGEGCVIKSAFLSNLVGLYSRTIIVTRERGAVIRIGANVGISGATIYDWRQCLHRRQLQDPGQRLPPAGMGGQEPHVPWHRRRRDPVQGHRDRSELLFGLQQHHPKGDCAG